MRALAWFLAAIAGTLLLAALAAWPVYALVHSLQPDWQFHRVTSRLWQLLMLAAIALAVWRLDLRGRADWGFGLPRARFLRQAGAGLALGIATMLPMAIAIVALGIRKPLPEFGATLLLSGIVAGALAGLIVAIVEETFFRGLMFRAVLRDAGPATAILATTLLYAAIHFFARTKIPHADVDWTSGMALLGSSLSRFADPAGIADAFITLALVGLLLGLVRYWTGSIAAGLGLHMGWICVIKATSTVTRHDEAAPWTFLVSSFDGFTGWLVAGWSCAILLAVYLMRGRFAGWRAGQHGRA
jgi:CAAX protease family protein